jgi:hypothetical protein
MPQIGFLFSTPAARSSSTKKSRNMITFNSIPGLRRPAANPNHHLWNNHGTWFLHYTVHPTPFTKDRIRRTLGTKDLAEARQRRDRFFAQLARSAPAASCCDRRDQVAA